MKSAVIIYFFLSFFLCRDRYLDDGDSDRRDDRAIIGTGLLPLVAISLAVIKCRVKKGARADHFQASQTSMFAILPRISRQELSYCRGWPTVQAVKTTLFTSALHRIFSNR